MYKIIKYNIKQHGKQMQNLLDKYIIPTYMKRMGLKPEQQMEYAEFEPALDPKGAYHKRLENHSLVAVDDDGKLIGCQTNFFLQKREILEETKKLEEMVTSRRKLEDLFTEYCRHRLKIENKILQLLSGYPTIEKVFYLESTILEPSWRRQNLSAELHFQSLNVAGPEAFILIEGMMPLKKYLEGINRRDIGYIMHSVDFTKDGFACPIFYRPPLSQ